MTPSLVALALASVQPVAEPPPLSIEAQASLRCSAAFALVAYGQEAGDPASAKWPEIDPRGREYFVRTLARIMDEAKIDRDQAADLAELEARRLLDSGNLDAVMPACLQLLDASGL